MTTVESMSQTANDLKDTTMGGGGAGSSSSAALSGVEPVSGLQGKGTATEPYDQGNADDPVLSGEEPPSGVQGEGTTTDPYDGGNAPGEFFDSTFSPYPYHSCVRCRSQTDRLADNHFPSRQKIR